MLRPHQEVAVEALRQSLRKGNMRPLLAAPCSMGKTMIAAHIMMNAAEKGIRSVFFCDRIKLVSQTTDTFDRLGASYSVLQGDDPRYNPRKLNPNSVHPDGCTEESPALWSSHSG